MTHVVSALRLVVVSAIDVVPEKLLVARLEALAELPVLDRATTAVWLRDKQLPPDERARLGLRLRDVSASMGMLFIASGHPDFAKALEADGVHQSAASSDAHGAERVAAVKKRLGAHAIVTRACHDLGDVVRAANDGVTAALLSPIFESPGKGAPLGLDALVEARLLLERGGHGHLGLVALGGIHPTNARSCIEAGASGVAAVRAAPSVLWSAIRKVAER